MDQYEIHVAGARQLLTECHTRYNGRFSADQSAALAQVEALLAIAAAIRSQPAAPATHTAAAAQAAAIATTHHHRQE
ncbi:hypothetical protein AB0O31_06660 [Kitasatospora cineracea]|uniref:hypothetical protein n=1 Tax=Kitasatospora cineracea TaxID=88074 RepID=UPI003429AF98